MILGGMISTEIRKEPLYVVDGKIISNPNDIDIYNIEDITVLKGNEATALFGVDGSNGAIVIKLKKRKLLPDSNKLPAYKTLENVMVISGYTKGRISCVTTGATIVKREMVDSLSISELLTKKISPPPQNLFLPLKIYPNPVQKGQTIHISFSNKGTTHAIQITNSLGVVVLSKRCGSGVLPSEIHAKSTEEIPIDIQWSSGMYYISVLNENNVVIAQSSFLVF
ncbi:MAG: T9SS type A sorting domain-containing protein [Chitinophagaceae bacterium]|nr:T9SS type A sorting domain-containing protein [Chitinophagaceae bacterium]